MNRISKSSQRDPPSGRRRVAQACGTCRSRKVRCDAGVPKCSLCNDLSVECVYLEPESQRIDPNTRLLLDRIQKLEDRIFAESTVSTLKTPVFESTESGLHGVVSRNIIPDERVNNPATQPLSIDNASSPGFPSGQSPGIYNALSTDIDVLTLPATHNANTSNVFRWDLVQSLLSEEPEYLELSDVGQSLVDATDIFLLSNREQSHEREVTSWHVLADTGIHLPRQDSHPRRIEEDEQFQGQADRLRDLVRQYFINIHAFYPILREPEVYRILQHALEPRGEDLIGVIKYCSLLLVLCLGSFAKSGDNLIYSNGVQDPHMPVHNGYGKSSDLHASMSDEVFWRKAKLLLGTVSLENSIEAAQCFALSSVYLGAKGRSLESHQQMHGAARKMCVLAKRTLLQAHGEPEFSDSFRRLFWVIYVCESDFAMEFSLIPPSGITRFEDLVPYPTSDRTRTDYDTPMGLGDDNLISYPGHASSPTTLRQLDLGVFQISTNSAIRRFLNRITAVVYNPQEVWRKQNLMSYANWLLKVTNELLNHHEAIHGNLPAFLLSTDSTEFWQHEPGAERSQADARPFYNHLWNVSRLRGRYCAGQYLICRATFEFVLLHPTVIDNHPAGQELLEKCSLCLKACVDFIKTFNVVEMNSMTNLFATGMATFAMVMILMISTTSVCFRKILPPDIEAVIGLGQRNLNHFSCSVKEFEWHLKALERLDRARETHNGRIAITNT